MATTPRYDIIAFYKNTQNEVQFYAEALKSCTQWKIRYEQLPANPKFIKTFFDEDTTLCIINRDRLTNKELYKYTYQLERPILIMHDHAPILHKISLPVNYTKETKETVAWANYLIRTTSAQSIRLVVPNEKDENYVHGVSNNLYYMRKVFHDSSTAFEETESPQKHDDLIQTMMQDAQHLIITMRPQAFLGLFKPQLFKHLPQAKAQFLLIPTAQNIYVPCH